MDITVDNTNDDDVTVDATNDDEVTLEDPKAVLAALNKAKKEAKKFREERDEARKSGSEKFVARVIKSEAKVALAAEGVKDSDRLLSLIDTSKVTLDENEEIVGLDDEIERLKTTFPELFDIKRQVGGKADLFKDGKGAPKSAIDRLAQQLTR